MAAFLCPQDLPFVLIIRGALQVFTERQVRRGFVEYSTLNQFESQIKEIANLQDQRDQAKRLKQAHDLAGIKQLSLAEAAQ